MKKSLVLALVLVMALSATSFAAVTFSGEYEAKISQEVTDGDLEFVKGKFGFDQSLFLNTSSSADGFKFSTRLNVNTATGALTLNRQKLEITDDLFDLAIWARSARLAWKATPLNIIRAERDAAATGYKARLTVKPFEGVGLATDYDTKQLKSFADVKVGGYDLGIAHQRDFGAKELDSIAAYGKTNLKDMIGTDVAVNAVVGLTLDNDSVANYKATDSMVYGLEFNAKPTSLIQVTGSIVEGKPNWSAKSGGTVDNTDKRTIKGDVVYRFTTDTVAYGDIFATDKFFNNNAAAVGLFAESTTGKVSAKADKEVVNKITAKATAPIMSDFAWAMATGAYSTAKDKGEVKVTPVTTEIKGENLAQIDGHIRVKVSEKLGIQPYATYWNVKDQADAYKIATLVEYEVGKASLSLEAYSTTAKFDEAAKADETKQGVIFKASVAF